MSTLDTMTDTIRIRIEPEKKEALSTLYKKRGTNISQAVRRFFDSELEVMSDPLDRFDAIMSSANKKLDAYDAPEPTVEDIVSYVEDIRRKRSEEIAISA